MKGNKQIKNMPEGSDYEKRKKKVIHIYFRRISAKLEADEKKKISKREKKKRKKEKSTD